MALADQLAASIAARAGEHDRDNTFPYEAMQAHPSGRSTALPESAERKTASVNSM